MKKITVLIGIAVFAFGNVNAQDGPSKKETFEFIVMMINNSTSHMSVGMSWRTIVKDSNYDDLTIELQENTIQVSNREKLKDIITLPLEDLKSLMDVEEEVYYNHGVYRVTINSKKKYESRVYEINGSLRETYDKGTIVICFEEEKDAERLIKALKHLQKLLKGNMSKSLFD